MNKTTFYLTLSLLFSSGLVHSESYGIQKLDSSLFTSEASNEFDSSLNAENITRGRKNLFHSPSKRVQGSLSIVLDEELGEFIVKRTNGRGFSVSSFNYVDSDVSETANRLGIIVAPAQNGTPCSQSQSVVVRQIVINADVKFDCSCANNPIITTGLAASQNALFTANGFFSTISLVAIHTLTSEIFNVTANGFSVAFIIVLVGANQASINDAVIRLLPTVAIDFSASCCV